MAQVLNLRLTIRLGIKNDKGEYVGKLAKFIIFTVVWIALNWVTLNYLGFGWGIALIGAMVLQGLGAYLGWWRDHIAEFLNK